MALSEATLSAITARVRDRMIGTVLGREASSAGTTETEIAGAAVLFCNQVAPDAPEAILREASIRLAGWLYGNRPHVVRTRAYRPLGNHDQAPVQQFGRDRERLSGVWRVVNAGTPHQAPGRPDRCNVGTCDGQRCRPGIGPRDHRYARRLRQRRCPSPTTISVGSGRRTASSWTRHGTNRRPSDFGCRTM